VLNIELREYKVSTFHSRYTFLNIIDVKREALNNILNESIFLKTSLVDKDELINPTNEFLFQNAY